MLAVPFASRARILPSPRLATTDSSPMRPMRRIAIAMASAFSSPVSRPKSPISTMSIRWPSSVQSEPIARRRSAHSAFAKSSKAAIIVVPSLLGRSVSGRRSLCETVELMLRTRDTVSSIFARHFSSRLERLRIAAARPTVRSRILEEPPSSDPAEGTYSGADAFPPDAL